MESSKNPFDRLIETLTVGDQTYKYYSLKKLNDPRVGHLPYSIRVLLECALRNCDEFNFKTADVEKILNWDKTSKDSIEVPFKPARVLLQDFTGVPCVVDLAAMRDAMKKLGGNPDQINPACPVDLVIDHSVQVDFARTVDAREKNEEMEFNRNSERFAFLKWGQTAFDNFLIVPPGSGIVHQVNLEHLGRVVMNKQGVVYPDSVVGTDSHTTMIDALGIVGWGVGGIEAEAVMLGEAVSMVLPEVVGFKLIGSLPQNATATDLVLTATEILRKRKVVGKFVEFFGPGVSTLSIADRATISNMSPEYGATMGFFPIDAQTIDYLRTTGRSKQQLELIEQYAKAQGLFRVYTKDADPDPHFSGDVIELDLSTVVPCISGPKRPQDRVPLSKMKQDWSDCLKNPVGFKGFGVPAAQHATKGTFTYQGQEYHLSHGSVVIAAITSCTNTSNPDVMIAAGIVAKNALAKGLKVAPYIKTSLSPGSGVVTKYFETAGLTESFNKLGFNVAGFGCMTCIGNSGELDDAVAEAIVKNELVASAVLSGNRNFEGRVHPHTRANYLASPPLVVAYALAGTVDIDFEHEPIGKGTDGSPVFLRDIWPTREEIQKVTLSSVKAEYFAEVYSKIAQGTERWNALKAPTGRLFEWQASSTYIHNPPFFSHMKIDLPKIDNIHKAYCLANLGDSITTDHISPAGNISKSSPAAKFLVAHGVNPPDFNTYGARRGNDEIMARGTFANTRLKNKLLQGKEAPQTIHMPSNETVPIFEAAERYIKEGHQTIILAGQEYGSGSSRDWAAKGPYMLGVKAVIAQSYERIHRSNLIGMGILPLEFLSGESADSLGLTGHETYDIDINHGDLKVGQTIDVHVSTGKKITVKTRLDTDVEIAYFKHGGILHYVLRKLAKLYPAAAI